MNSKAEDARRLKELQRIVQRFSLGGTSKLSENELIEFPRLYRFASSQLAQLETLGVEPGKQENLRSLLAKAHAILYRPRKVPIKDRLAKVIRFLFEECPRTMRSEWKLLLSSVIIFYGLSTLSFFLVRHDLGLAYTLFDPAFVNIEIAQIEATPEDEPFRGNFTFGIEQSSGAAGMILAHNMYVSVLYFGSGLIPPLYLQVLLTNALMLGTYTGVASHWGRAGEISSILWCHGVLEIQAIILAGAAGLVLFRAWIAPGPWTRAHAMRLEAVRAWRLMAPVFPILFISGLIEGFISPHAPTEARIATAILTGFLFLAWILFGGRNREPQETTTFAPLN